MKKSLIIIIVFGLISLVWLQPFNLGTKEVTIPKNSSAKEVAEILSKNHIIRADFELLFWLKLLGKENHLGSGRYQLSIYKNPIYIIHRLTQGGRSDIAITIPEGLTVRETAEVLYKNNLITNPERFLELCNDKNLIKKFGLNTNSLEGYLFPDTYSFEENGSLTKIISKMVENFKEQVKKITTIPVESLQTFIIIASLVEKEAKYNEERPIIARVFFNRLKLNRPLESCATVIYALKQINPDTVITYLREKDLKVNSPYNTYIHSGLPPGPICSPGLNSIKSALSPADVDFIYFVARGDGYHHFSKTYKEHLTAKEYYNAKK